MKVTKAEIKLFKEQVCSKCHCNETCKNKDEHWFIACPKMFNYKLGFKNGLYNNGKPLSDY